MAAIAQELTETIVEPACIERTTANIGIETSWHKPTVRLLGTNLQNKPTRSIIVEKEKIINKLVPRSSKLSDKGHSIINQYKSKETILKKLFTETAVNTTESGTSKSDGQCVTSIRRRDGNSCRCSPRHNKCQVLTQEIQTSDTKLVYIDRACSRCFQQLSRGTQVLGTTGEVKIFSSIGLDPRTACRGPIQIPRSERKSSHCIMGARRWSLSKYAQRGPDF